MSRVFIPHMPLKRKQQGGALEPMFDIKPARHFGSIVMLNGDTTEGSGRMFFPVPTMRDLRVKLRDFNDDDYIVAIGDPSLICAAAMIASHRNHGRVKLLKWDRLQRCYLSVQLDTTGRAI